MSKLLATLPVTERAFAQAVVQFARLMGWRLYRTWSSIHSPAGFPDLCMVRGDRLIFAELKNGIRKPSPEQEAWLADLRATGKAEVYLWRPADWEGVVAALGREP